MCCTRLAGNTGCKKSPKIRHLGTIAQLCQAVSSQLMHVLSTVGKNVKQHYLLNMFSQYGEFWPISGWDRFTSLAHPANFNGFRVLASLLQRHRSSEVNQTFARWLAVSWAGTLHFRGLLPLTEFCHVQNSRYVQVLRSPILAALLHGTPAAGVSQTLRRGTRNRITELSQNAPPTFGWADITLGIGSHCSFFIF